MKYFVGVPIPKDYKNKIELLRARFAFFTTEPHITLIPPPALPDEDDFIKDLIEVCKTIKPFTVKLRNIGQFGNRVLYVSVQSPDLTILYEKINEKLNLEKEKRGYTPHLTIVKQRLGRKVDIEKAKEYAMNLDFFEYTLNSIVVYHQPKEHSIYVPYMEVPLGYSGDVH